MIESTQHDECGTCGLLGGAHNRGCPNEQTVLDAVSLADLLCDQLQLFMEEGGNDMQGEYVDEVTLGGRIVTVEWSNGQKFRIEVEEV